MFNIFFLNGQDCEHIVQQSAWPGMFAYWTIEESSFVIIFFILFSRRKLCWTYIVRKKTSKRWFVNMFNDSNCSGTKMFIKYVHYRLGQRTGLNLYDFQLIYLIDISYPLGRTLVSSKWMRMRSNNFLFVAAICDCTNTCKCTEKKSTFLHLVQHVSHYQSVNYIP